MLGPNSTLLFKYIGSVFAALYGLWATLTDFHETKHGKKVLTRKGYIGIALLVSASSLSIFSDWNKDKIEEDTAGVEEHARDLLLQQEKSTALAVAKQVPVLDGLGSSLKDTQTNLQSTARVLDKTSGNAQSAFHESQRINNPLQDFGAISFTLSIPVSDPAVAPYHQRVSAIHRYSTPKPGEDTFPHADDPKESDLAALALLKGFTLILATKEQGKFKWHLNFDARCEPDRQFPDDDRHVTDDDITLQIRCEDDNPEHSNDDGTITSRLDLPGKFLLVLIAPGVRGDEPLAKFDRIPLQLDLEMFYEGDKRTVLHGFSRCGSSWSICLVKKLSAVDVQYYNSEP